MALGAAEDVVRAPDLVVAKAKMTLLRLAGFSRVRVTSQWQPGPDAPPSTASSTVLRNVAAAAQLSGVRVYVSVYHAGSRDDAADAGGARRSSPRTSTALVAAAARRFDDVIVGNEPNLNRFWLPQFDPDGIDAAAPAYLALLARTYDARQGGRSRARASGAARSRRAASTGPRHRPRHALARPRSSGTLGAAYRASGRTLPVMDGFAFHPYADTSGAVPRHAAPELDHDRRSPTTTSSSALLGDGLRRHAPSPARRCRSSTTSSASSRTIPAGKAERLHRHRAGDHASPSTRRTQARVLRAGARSSRSASRTWSGCSSSTRSDEPALASWQSGVYYADGTPKSSLYAVRDALAATRGGSIARCDGLGARRHRHEGAGSPTQRRARSAAPRRPLHAARSTAPGSCGPSARHAARRALRLTGYGRAGRPLVDVAARVASSARGPVRLHRCTAHATRSTRALTADARESADAQPRG